MHNRAWLFVLDEGDGMIHLGSHRKKQIADGIERPIAWA
jgi:hypothetical protein